MISWVQVQDVQKHALELIEIFRPFLRFGRRQLQSEGMNSPLHPGVIAERARKNLIPAEGQAIFSADLFHPDHDRIKIGGWAVIIVTPEWGMNTDNMGGLESVN